jgi:hypothetical protein
VSVVGWWRSGPPRMRLRRRLLAYSAPIAVVVLVAVAKLVSVGIAGDSAVANFADRDAAALRGDVAVLNLLNVVEPEKAYFAAGALAALEGRLPDADARFAQALARTEPAESCAARVNLELVREALGDKALASFDGASAAERYLSALAVVQGAPTGCFPDDTESRLNAKADAARVAPPPPPPPPPVPAPPPPPSPTDSGQRDRDTRLRLNPGAGDPLDRLQQILRDAAAARG